MSCLPFSYLQVATNVKFYFFVVKSFEWSALEFLVFGHVGRRLVENLIGRMDYMEVN